MSTREIVKRIMSESGVDSYADMDSLDTLDICLALEKEFGVVIPDDELGKVATEDGLVEMIDGLRAKV